MDTVPASNLTRLQTLTGMRRWLTSSMLAAVFYAITAGAYATGYALHLGASKAMIGILGAAPSIGLALQFFSPLWTERLRKRKPFCLGTFGVAWSFWLLIALIPWFVPAGGRAWAMIALVLLSGMTLAMVSPLSMSWVSDLVPLTVRGRFFGRQSSQMGLVGLVASLAAGWYMDLPQFAGPLKQAGFTSLFLVAVLFCYLSLGVWWTVPEPEPARETPKERLDPRLLLLPFKHRSFRDLTMFVAIRTTAVMMAAPFFAVYMIEDLQIDYKRIAAFSITVSISSMIANPMWGYLADKFGYKPILRITSFGIALNPLPWAFATRGNYFWLLPLAQAWAGAMGAGLIQSQLNLMLKTAPKEHQSVYIGCYQSVANLASALGSMLGGLLAKWFATFGVMSLGPLPITDLQLLFLVSCLLRMSGLAFLTRVREADSTSAMAVIKQVGSGNPLRTAVNLYRLQHSGSPQAKARATRALGQARNPLAVDELIAALSDSDRDVRREAARALGLIADPRAVEPLLAAIEDESADVAEEAVEAVGRLAPEVGLPALLPLLNHPREAVRKAAAKALAELGRPEAIAPLQSRLSEETEPQVFLALTAALGAVGGVEAMEPLRLMLRDSEPGVSRRQVASAIAHLFGRRDAFYRLLEAEPMRQDEMLTQLLQRGRRRPARQRLLPRDDQRRLEARVALALRYVERPDGFDLARILHLAARGALRAHVRGRNGAGLQGAALDQAVAAFRHDRPTVALCEAYLARLAAETPPLHREEILLAVHAFSRLIDGLLAAHSRRGVEG